MRRFLISAALAAGLGWLPAWAPARGAEAAAPAPGPAPASPAAGSEALGSPEEELGLAELAFEKGLSQFAQLRLARVVQGPAFSGMDRAELLLAESLYLCGHREEAVKRLNGFSARFPKSTHLLECRLWLGRAKEEVERDHPGAAGQLRKLLADLGGQAARSLEAERRARLVEACRYFLSLALVEQGGSQRLDQVADPESAGRGLLDQLIKDRPEGGRFLAEAQVLRGRALCLRGRPEQCFSRLQEFLDAGEKGSGTFCAQHPEGPFRQKVPDPFSPALRAEALFWQAEARYGQARWEEADKLYTRAAEVARGAGPGTAALCARALYGRGWAAAKRAEELRRSALAGERERLEAALASFTEASRQAGELKDPALAGAAELRAGEALLGLERRREALARLEPLFGDAGRAVEARYLAALAETGLGRHDAARQLLAEALQAAGQKSPLAPRIEFARGQNAFQQGQWEEAGQAFGRAVKLSGSGWERPWEAQLWAARTLAKQLRFQEAVEQAVPLLENALAREELGRDRLDYLLGEILLSQARAGRKAVILKGPGDAGPAERDARAEAARAFTQAYQTGPRGRFAVSARLGAAEAYLLMEPPSTQEAFLRYAEAVQDAQATDQQREAARLGTAQTLRISGSFQKAAAFLQGELLEARTPPSAPARRQALVLRAECLELAGDAEGAAAAFGRLAEDLGSGPEAARARLKRAEQLRKLGRHAEAAGELAALAADGPPELRAEASFAAAEANLAAGRSPEALKHYQECARLGGPRRAQARVGAATLELEAGRAAAAERSAREALDELDRAAPGERRERMLTARAALVRAKALLAAGDASAAAGQYGRAASEAVGASAAESVRREARLLELEAYLGLGQALLAAGRGEDAAASFLRAGCLPERESHAELRGELERRSAGALSLAAEALQSAGQPRAAEQLRALGAARRNQPGPAPAPAAAPKGK